MKGKFYPCIECRNKKKSITTPVGQSSQTVTQNVCIRKQTPFDFCCYVGLPQTVFKDASNFYKIVSENNR